MQIDRKQLSQPSVNPTVSVIMTAYNEEKFINEAIKSVLRQTLQNWELIVVDDGSADRTAKIASMWAERDLRVRLLRRPHEGRAAALNTGLSAARGRYVAILDADDVALPTRLEEQVKYLDNHPDIGIVGSFCMYRDVERGTEWIGEVPIEDRAIRRTVFWRMPFNHTTLMIRREVVGELRYEGGEFFKDYVFCALLLAECKAANIPKPLVIVNRHIGSVTQHSKRTVNYAKSFKTQLLVLKVLRGKPYHYLVLSRPLLGLVKYYIVNGILGNKR